MAGKTDIRSIQKTGHIILSIVFVFMLILPAIQWIFPVFPNMESTEKRQLAPKPKIRITYLDGIPKHTERYFNDHFSLRNQLIRLKAMLSTNVFKISPNPDKVIFGEGNWLFMVREELATYRGTNLFGPAQLDTIKRELIRRKDYFDRQGIQLYFAILPTKYSIYPEKLPFYVNRVNEINRTDQVIELLASVGISTIDLRKPLKAEKDQGTLYYATDNHWNELGGYFGSRIIINRVRQDFPQIMHPPDLSEYIISYDTLPGRNLARLINLSNQYHEREINLNPKFDPGVTTFQKYGFSPPDDFEYAYLYELDYTTNRDSLPDALVFRDSFGNAMVPFLSESFDSSVFIFDKWRYKMNPNIVEKVQPDIVIYAVLESLWSDFLKGIREEQKAKD